MYGYYNCNIQTDVQEPKQHKYSKVVDLPNY